ncbi:50S ribosomal protein L11 [Nocardia amamiensis]|uniref:Large ribosomal subunit protein uL11 n=2 Tax=Nocardia amamiensis TaxID=404578 RepID=A0ABS0D2J0_9NOCA|nr:50S ribosomal protein L11 [Nocardia amamiensis]
MSKNPVKQTRTVTMHLDAGNASMVELGKMLGPTGIPPFAVKKEYDALTASSRGEIIPAVVTFTPDRKWSMRLKTPPTSALIRTALGGSQGSSRPGHDSCGSLTRQQLRAIAQRKLPDLNTSDVEVAMRIVAGTARSMGVRVAS